MDTRAVEIGASVVIALMIAASVAGIAILPADTTVPIHFGLDGKADSWARPLVALSLLPLVTIVVLSLCLWTGRRATGGLAHSDTAFRWSVFAVVGLLAGVHALVVMAAFGRDIDAIRGVALLTGLQFVVLGNVMGKIRPNRSLGIRTRWTLRDGEVWDRTHRFGGWLFVGAGAALTLAALLGPGGTRLSAILLATLAVVVLALYVKSYLVWRDRQNA